MHANDLSFAGHYKAEDFPLLRQLLRLAWGEPEEDSIARMQIFDF